MGGSNHPETPIHKIYLLREEKIHCATHLGWAPKTQYQLVAEWPKMPRAKEGPVRSSNLFFIAVTKVHRPNDWLGLGSRQPASPLSETCCSFTGFRLELRWIRYLKNLHLILQQLSVCLLTYLENWNQKHSLKSFAHSQFTIGRVHSLAVDGTKILFWPPTGRDWFSESSEITISISMM